MEKRTNKKLISFSDRNLDMIDAISKETGWDTPTQVVKRGIEELYKQTFKYGKDPLSIAQDGDSVETIGKKAERKAEGKRLIKEAEEKAKLAPKIQMCENLLNGEITTNENGFKFCKFTQYTMTDDKECIVPILQVAPIIAETSLFMPDRETVFKRRPEVKKLFAKLEKKNA